MISKIGLESKTYACDLSPGGGVMQYSFSVSLYEKVIFKLLSGTKLMPISKALIKTKARTNKDVLPNDLAPNRHIIRLTVVMKVVYPYRNQNEPF